MKMKAIVWGQGGAYNNRKIFINLQYDIVAFTDNSRKSKGLGNYVCPENLSGIYFDKILVCNKEHFNDIKKQLIEEIGVDEDIIIDVSVEKQDCERCVLLYNPMSIDEIIKLEKFTHVEEFFPWKKCPFYVLFEGVQYEEIEKQLSKCGLKDNERVVVFYSIEELRLYIEDLQSMLPDMFFNENNELLQIVEEEKRKREKVICDYRNKIKNYYLGKEKEINNKIVEGTSKILILATRFIESQSASDCYEACIDLGYEAFLSIERDNISRVCLEKTIWEFKPDIIFMEDKYRCNYEVIPDEIIVVSQLDEEFEWLWKKEILDKLTKRDILLLISKDYYIKRFQREKKQYNIISDFIWVCVNERNIIPFSNEKKENDICYISNNSDYISILQTRKNIVKEKCGEKCANIFIEYAEKLYQEIYDGDFDLAVDRHEDGWEQYIDYKNLNLTNLQNEILIYEIWRLRYFMEKHILARWLVESGYKVVFYGLAWQKDKLFAKYAKGFAPSNNLSNIYSSAYIGIGSHPQMTLSDRVNEIIASGTLCLVQDMPKETDVLSAHRYYEDKQSIVFYNGKKELLNKIEIYISNAKEREQIVLNGQKVIRKYLTHKVLMKNVMKEIRTLVIGGLGGKDSRLDMIREN